jgi:hypothetical protein
MLPSKARSPTRETVDGAPAKVGFGKRDKLPDSKRGTRRQQLACALWHGSKPAAGAQAFDPRAFECWGGAAAWAEREKSR